MTSSNESNPIVYGEGSDPFSLVEEAVESVMAEHARAQLERPPTELPAVVFALLGLTLCEMWRAALQVFDFGRPTPGQDMDDVEVCASIHVESLWRISGPSGLLIKGEGCTVLEDLDGGPFWEALTGGSLVVQSIVMKGRKLTIRLTGGLSLTISGCTSGSGWRVMLQTPGRPHYVMVRPLPYTILKGGWMKNDSDWNPKLVRSGSLGDTATGKV